MKKRIFLFLILINTQAVFAEADMELAHLYINEAFYYFERENYTSADKYLQNSMEYSDELPQSWYLSGLIREEQGNRLKALDLYKRSIALCDVYTDFFYDLYFRYLNLLNITAHHNEVLIFYKDNRELFARNNEIILTVADSAYKLGLNDYSIELASDVYKRNPYNLKSILYLIRSTGDSKYFSVIEKSLHNLKTDKLDEIVFQELILNNSVSFKDSIIKLYRAVFGETPFYFVLMDVEDSSINESRNLVIRSSGNETLEDGVYFGDYNFDGTSDEIISVSGKNLTFLKDKNQDNITDLSINFTNGIPTGIYINKGDIGYEIKYTEYPYVEEIHYIHKEITRIYKIFPGSPYSPLLDLPAFNWKYNKHRNLIVADFELNPVDLLSMSYLFEESFSGNRNISREYHIKDGEITVIKEDLQSNGIFDHFMDVSAWQIESGKRDLNEDGIIDLYEYYKDGIIAGIAVDWDNNGKSEYLEDWSVLDIKTWDFNEDSYSDAEYISSHDGDVYSAISIEKDIVNEYDIYSWDFSFKNFWFDNN